MPPAATKSVLGVGVSTGPGRGARNVALAVRAGWREPTSLWFRPEDGEGEVKKHGYVTGIAAPGLDRELPRRDRIVRLSVEALREATKGWKLGKLPLIMALPEPVSSIDAFDPQALAVEIAAASLAPVDPRRIVATSGGHAAAAQALLRAIELFERSDAPPAVIVGAADSLVAGPCLVHLVEWGRLVPAGWSGSSGQGGVTPSEGAAFLVLAKPDPKSPEPMPELTHVDLREWKDDDEDSPLQPALEDATSGIKRVWLLSDINGETSRVENVSDALRDLRASRGERGLEIRDEGLDDTLGELGVANLLMGLALSVTTFGLKGASEEACLAVAGVDQDFLGIAVVRCPETTPVAPRALAPRTTSAHHLAATLAPMVSVWAERIFAVQHRLITRVRDRLTEARDALAAAVHDVIEARLDEGFPPKLDALGAAAKALARAARIASRSAAKKGRGAEPALDRIHRAASRFARMVPRERGRAVAAIAGLDQPKEETVDLGFLLSGASPAPIAMPYAKGKPAAVGGPDPLGVDELEEEADDDEPEPKRDEELTPAEIAAREAAALAASIERTSVRNAVDAAVGAIGYTWQSRHLHGDIPWRPDPENERDMLANVDWFHAVVRTRREGGSYGTGAEITTMFRDADSASDAGRVFARAFLLASSTDPRLVRVAVEKMRSPTEYLERAYADALALGGSAAIDEALQALVHEPNARTVRLALEVMERRRATSIGVVAPLLYHADTDVRRAAARAVVVAEAKESAVLCLETRLQTERSILVSAEIITGLVRLQAEHADAHLARTFAELVALGQTIEPEAREARLVLARASAALGRTQEVLAWNTLAEEPDEIEVLGWFGRVSAVDKLIKRIETASRLDIMRASARAVQRILGVVPEAGPRGWRMVDGRLSTVDDDRLSYDAKLHRSYWESEGAQLGSSTKHRFGVRHEIAQSITELGGRAREADRRMSSLEIAVTRGHDCRLLPDLDDWIPRQLAAISLAASSSSLVKRIERKRPD